MLGAVDAVRRPLKIPPRFIPYMEKHRIYELFHEIALQLVIKQPDDHVLYVKQCLKHAERCRDSPKVIILSPPDFDRDLLAEYLEKKLSISCIRLKETEKSGSFQDFASNVRKILRELYTRESGWLFIDFPRNVSEARALQRIGILPTHVVEIIWTDGPSEMSSVRSADSDTCFETSPTRIKPSFQQSVHNMEIRGLREVYANALITVETAGRTFEELGNAIVTIAKKRKPIAPCYNFRVVLIGPRGSGRRSVAKYIAQKYNLVYIDFDYLLEQTKMQNTSLGEELRRKKYRWGDRPEPVVRAKIIENKLLSHECLKKGWVLMGYPITVQDFQLLDLLPTAPNRVIILSIDEAICKKQLLSRKFNVLTGSEHNLPGDFTIKGLEIHRDDYKLIVERDMQEYFENIEMLMRYAGESAKIIDATSDESIVKEKVETSLMYFAPSAPPRMLKLKQKIQPEDVEFDPDDPVSSEIFNELRAAESILSLV